jgi:hypothetical protein
MFLSKSVTVRDPDGVALSWAVEASRQYEQLRDLLRANLAALPAPRVSGMLRAGQPALT